MNAAWEAWQDMFLSLVNKFVPSKVVKHIKAKNLFVTPAIENAIKEKRIALRVLKKHPTLANKEVFKRKRNLVTHLLRKSERAHATSLHRSSRLSPSASSSQNFWQYIKIVQGKTKRTFQKVEGRVTSHSHSITKQDKKPLCTHRKL